MKYEVVWYITFLRITLEGKDVDWFIESSCRSSSSPTTELWITQNDSVKEMDINTGDIKHAIEWMRRRLR